MEIIGYPNYLIFEDGRVYNREFRRFKTAWVSTHGYYRIGLSNNGKKKHHFLHRLIAIHYIPNPLNLPVVDHIDRNRLNNDISNLRWVTSQGNAHNRKKMPNTISKGVYKTKCATYRAQLNYTDKETKKRMRFSKTFPTLEEALRYRKMLECKYFVV